MASFANKDRFAVTYGPLDEIDVGRIVRRIPKALAGEMKEVRSIIGGGFVRAVIAGEKPSDIDVFGPTAEIAKAMAKEFAKATGAPEPHESENSLTVGGRPPVQFIHRWTYEDAERLLDSFDFTVGAAAIWWNGQAWASLADQRFYRDLAARRMVFRDPRDNTAGGSLLRLQKFAARGYRASAYQVARVALSLAASAGADRDTQAGLIRLIREVDPRGPEWDGDHDAGDGEKPPAPVDADDEVAF